MTWCLDVSDSWDICPHKLRLRIIDHKLWKVSSRFHFNTHKKKIKKKKWKSIQIIQYNIETYRNVRFAKWVPKVVPPLLGRHGHVDVHLHDAPGHTSSTSRQHCTATLLEIDTVASCRSRELSKSEMDRNGTILNDLIYSHLLHLLPLIGFPGISGAIWTRKWGYLPLSSFTLSVAQASESSASQGSKKFSTTCQALGTCRTYENFDETQSSRFNRFAQLIIRKSSKHLQS